MNLYFSKLKQCIATISLLTLVMLSVSIAEADSVTPAVLKSYLKKGVVVAGEVGAIVPPDGINKYITKVREAAKADPEWHQEYAKKAQPGVPLPWHEKIGLAKDEYEEYLKLWGDRKFQVIHQVTLKLEEDKTDEWVIRVSGVGMPITLLRFNNVSGNFRSPNGELQRIEDVNAGAETILGAWKGQEWKYERVSDFISTKENFALGKFADGKNCLLVYRFQESASGRRLADSSLVIRFGLPK